MSKVICRNCYTKVSVLKMYANILWRSMWSYDEFRCKNCNQSIFKAPHPFIEFLYGGVAVSIMSILRFVGERFFELTLNIWYVILITLLSLILMSPLCYKTIFWYEEQKLLRDKPNPDPKEWYDDDKNIPWTRRYDKPK